MGIMSDCLIAPVHYNVVNQNNSVMKGSPYKTKSGADSRIAQLEKEWPEDAGKYFIKPIYANEINH